jgi:phosphoribosyl-AMP cyclohydrolase
MARIGGFSDLQAAINNTVMSKEDTKQLLLDFGTDGNQLVPVITQNSITKEVLILSWVNKEAFEETRKSGYATYFSRTRNELWKKGATSGDYLKVVDIRINCEQNSLLFLVIPEGKGVCHARKSSGLPYSTCYYRQIIDGELKIIEE